MEKLLFYTNKWDKVVLFVEHYNDLLLSGYEVAFATDSIEVAKRLSIGKMLVVKLGTYTPDIVVSTTKLEEHPDALTLSQFIEALK